MKWVVYIFNPMNLCHCGLGGAANFYIELLLWSTQICILNAITVNMSKMSVNVQNKI